MFVKAPFLAVESELAKEAITGKAAETLRGNLYADGRWHVDYVRIRMKSVRL